MLSARTALLTSITMAAFATNSLLCRLALGPQLIDAATFTSIRVTSGALMLGLNLWARGHKPVGLAADWRAVPMLLASVATRGGVAIVLAQRAAKAPQS